MDFAAIKNLLIQLSLKQAYVSIHIKSKAT